MKTGDRVRVKSLKEVLKIEGAEDYNDIDKPRVSEFMLEFFEKEGSVHLYNDDFCFVLFDEQAWVFKKEWLDEGNG